MNARLIALCPPYLSAIAPNIGPDKPQPNIWIPIANPNSVFVIPKSILKSIKNIPNTCLTLKEIKTTPEAAISVTSAKLFFMNFSELILYI